MSKLQSYLNITTNATTVVSLVPCRLVKIVNNKPGASANTATVYDNTAGSGTKIGTIDTTQASVSEWGYNCNCITGLTIVTATGTAPDITVVIGPYQDESS